MKVAIIGTGISGLAAAHRLCDLADLTLFEADRRPGGHANTIVVESERGLESVDTGFIVFNDRNYPEFSRLLQELEVPSRPSSMSFSVSDGEFEYTGRSLNGLFARRRNLADPRFLRMLCEFPRFQKKLKELSAQGVAGPSLARFIEEEGFSSELRDLVVVPLVSAVWSADPRQMWTFPVGFLARFLDNHGLLSLRNRPRWRTVEGGSWSYVRALTEPFRDRIRLNAPVERIRRLGGGVEVTPRGAGAERFDQVVVATHSDQALRMLADPTRAEREVLGGIGYQSNEAVLHTDESLMPRRRAAWASWNYHLTRRPRGRTALTYDMNRLQSLECRRQFCVTLNLTERIDPAKVIASFRYEHPVFTPDAVEAQARWSEISGRDRIHFAGAYWRNGFHEDGVFSGFRAAEQVIRADALDALVRASIL
ncbi:MAG TPA: FAD-dependent oxidoreductase [Solirubrobacterales bacterium]|nr:FAD-dependent oxidoreductase [Solirubrobacterales bacterium]